VRRAVVVVLGVGIVLGLAVVAGLRHDAAEKRRSATASVSRPAGSDAPGAGPRAVDTAPPVVSARVVTQPATLASARWGTGRGELGRDRPAEGNPEGPMSFAFSGSKMLVVDQVNGRLVLYDKGKAVGTQTIRETVQDVAVAKDGTVALLDRLGDKNVTLTDSRGAIVGTLPLPGNDTGLLTGVFVDGDTVYVEQEHGGLVGVGTTDGQPLASPATLGGRPTKDGALLVNGTLNGPAGQLMINAIDRATGTSRYARVIQMPSPSHVIVLLDSDDQGVVYAGVAAGQPETANIACLDPGDGHVIGRVVVPMSSMPEESFRDFVVEGDGTIVYALRTEEGVSYDTARCP
jgi:hypothetical protein